MDIRVAIFAHQEEGRIAACLNSLPLDRGDITIHVLVNGSRDATAAIARRAVDARPHIHIHDLHPGGKSRTWNRFVHDIDDGTGDAYIFMDGDAEIATGSFDALTAAVRAPGVNAAAGLPLNGRRHRAYQRSMKEEGGLFGDLYALDGDFVRRVRAQALRLPDDLIGDDGLVAALAWTDLGPDADWDWKRVVPCDGAGFRCEPVRLTDPKSWRLQYRRMINYSVRFFQNRIVSAIMGREGPGGLPAQLSTLYPAYFARWRPRRDPRVWWFDRLALKRMKAAQAGS